ncbi:MAG: hypothetical protein ABIJ53_07660 [Verrucomicrobiota bacterium]
MGNKKPPRVSIREAVPFNHSLGILTPLYWRISRRIVGVEQTGQDHAAYGEAVMRWRAGDLTALIRARVT